MKQRGDCSLRRRRSTRDANHTVPFHRCITIVFDSKKINHIKSIKAVSAFQSLKFANNKKLEVLIDAEAAPKKQSIESNNFTFFDRNLFFCVVQFSFQFLLFAVSSTRRGSQFIALQIIHRMHRRFTFFPSSLLLSALITLKWFFVSGVLHHRGSDDQENGR